MITAKDVNEIKDILNRIEIKLREHESIKGGSISVPVPAINKDIVINIPQSDIDAAAKEIDALTQQLKDRVNSIK